MGHRGLGMNATNSLRQRGLLALYIYSVYTCTCIYKYLYLLEVFRTWSFLFCEKKKNQQRCGCILNCTSHLSSEDIPILLNNSTLFLAAEMPKQCCHFQEQENGSQRCIFVVCDRIFCCTCIDKLQHILYTNKHIIKI